MTRTVTLVDSQGSILEECPILEAHQTPGKLHRAFSAYLLSEDGTELLLQKRHEGKIFGGTWANTCCSHPFPGESAVDAGQRRIREELGIDAKLHELGWFIYQADDPRGIGSEHEQDILLKGSIDRATPVNADPKEVAEWKWMKIEELQVDMKKNMALYAPWFHQGLPLILAQ
jgi:isopentenyl-diphosphate delta-isomerase